MNNQSKKPEKLEPQDSEQKNIKHPENDEEAVVKAEDKVYHKRDATFVNPAKKREQQEQPVHPVTKVPEE
jgi:hypothetical protein